MRDPPTNYTDEDHDAESNDDSDEEYEDDQYLDEEYGDEYLDRHSLIELSSIRDPRLPYEHDNIGSRHSRPKSCCSGRQKACIIVSLLFIIYLVAKYDVDEVKWVVTEIESDLLGSRCINASFIQSERNIEPVVADTVPVDYNFSTFEPLGGGRFTEYKDGESPFDVTEEMKSESDRVALSRRLHVVNAMKHVWENYKERAFGMDELLPISGKGIDNWGSLGTTLVDSLDTLWIMGLKTEFQEGRDWVKEHLSHTLVGEVSTFETTTRILGGLISAYDLSDDTIFLKKAEYLAPRLFHAFESASGLPNGVVDLSVRTGKSHLSGHSYVLSEVASLQLEFGFMAKSTGKQDYRTKSEKVFDILQRISPRDGLMPLNLKEKRNGQAYFSNTVVSFGKGGPAYCYMLKMWLMGGKKDKKYRDLWDKSINGMHHHLLKKSIPNGLTYIVDRSNNRAGNEMSHQTCSIGGLLALGAYTDPEGMNSPRSERDLKTAKALAYTCYQMHARSATGLSPESVTFNDCTDFAISKSNPVYMLRSEAVESWYYLHELTGDPIYREWGWEVFLAIERYCKSQYGYASLKNVDLPSLHQIDKMESFFLAKTLKFLFLLFDPSSDIDIMSKHVFNTEAHVLQVFSG